MTSIALYPIVDYDVVHPHYTVQKAFESHFYPCYTYDWVQRRNKIGLVSAQAEFLEILKETKPDYAFMQLQNPLNMSVEMIREMARHTKIINWSGDVRDGKDWYKWFEEIGKEIYLTLFTNETDVELMRDRGVRADYLQIGYDQGWYYPGESNGGPEIVFCANHYPQFPLAKYRVQVVKALRHEFGERFALYGSGWEKEGIKTKAINCQQEGEAYRNAKIGISVSNFNLKRYHSDRLLRIMGSGCLALSHNFEGIEDDYPYGVHVFHTIEHMIGACHFYLEHEDARRVAIHGSLPWVQNNCTWDSRCKELIQLIEKWG